MRRDGPELPKRVHNEHTVKSLRLNIPAALKGESWKLLPPPFRAREFGKTYPLPSKRADLQKLAAIEVPSWQKKQDSGCIYVRRAIDKWKDQQQRCQSAIHDIGRRTEAIGREHRRYKEDMKGLRADARKAVNDVREEAVKQIASLSDLFSLGRRGIDKQMRAYLAGEQLHGERINARAFRECFRIVTQAVKGLGLPTDQKKKASEAIVEEVAKAIQATQEIVALEEAKEQKPDPDALN